MKIDRRERLICRQARGNVGPRSTNAAVARVNPEKGKFRKWGKLQRREGGSTTKHEIFYILGKEWRKDLQEGKFQ